MAACRRARLADLHFHDLRHTFVTRKVREGWDYKRIMAITGHKTFAVFQRYNNPSEDDIKEVVLADPPRKNGRVRIMIIVKLLSNGFTFPSHSLLSI